MISRKYISIERESGRPSHRRNNKCAVPNQCNAFSPNQSHRIILIFAAPGKKIALAVPAEMVLLLRAQSENIDKSIEASRGHARLAYMKLMAPISQSPQRSTASIIAACRVMARPLLALSLLQAWQMTASPYRNNIAARSRASHKNQNISI